MQPASPPLSPANLSRFSSPCQLPDSLTAAILVLVNKPDTHYYPVFHVQKYPPPDLTDIDTLGNQIIPYDQIAMGSDVDSDLRMFFAEPKHCSLIVDSLGKLFVVNFSSANPCLLNDTTLTTNTLHALENLDVIHVAGKNFRVEYKPGYPKTIKLSDSITSQNMSQTEEVLEDLDKSADLETIYPQSPARSPKIDRLSIRSSPRKQTSPHSSPGGNTIPPLPRKFVTYSSPAQSSTPATTKRAATPSSISDRRAVHDATDNSYASMEVNTSQPSLIARDMSTTLNVSAEPSERRRMSDFPKKTLSSPVKLKRKSAPITRVRISPRFSDHIMDSPNTSSVRRSTRTQQTPQLSSKSSLRKSSRESPKFSPPANTPNKYPSAYKHPNSTSLSARRSKSPLTLSSRKSVRFGPNLSPEEFYRNLPPSTPVKRGGTPVTRSATKAVLRRATPYKLPLSVATQFSQLSPKSNPASPDRFQNSPKFSPRQSLYKKQFSTPKLGKTLTPMKETKVTAQPAKTMVRETMLRRGLRSAVLSEMQESHNLKLSSRISTPTSIHSKLPSTLSALETSTRTFFNRSKVSNLASQQAKAPLLRTSPRLDSKSSGPLLSPKRMAVSPSNESGEIEFQQSAEKRTTMSPLQNYPVPTRISLPRKSKCLDLSSPQITTPDSDSSSNDVRDIDSPISGQYPSNYTPKLVHKTPEAGILPKLTKHSRNISLESPFRMSQRLSKSPDFFQSPPLSILKHQVVTPVHSSHESPAVPKDSHAYLLRSPPAQTVEVKSPALSNKSPAVSKKSPAVSYKSPVVSNKSPAVSSKSPAILNKSPAVLNKSPAVSSKSPAVSSKSPAILNKSPAVPNKSPAVSNKSPAVSSKSPAVSNKSPAVSNKSPAVSSKSPAVSNKSPAVSSKSPAVSSKSPAVSNKSPAVSNKSPAVSNKSPAVPNKSPAVSSKSPAVSSKSPAVSNKSPAVLNKSPAVLNKSPAVSSKSPAVQTSSISKSKSPGLRPRLSSTPASRSSSVKRVVRMLSPQVQINHPLVMVSPEFQRSVVYDATPKLRPRTSRSSASTPSTQKTADTPVSARVASPRYKKSSISPLPYSPRRERSLGSSKALRLAWVSPTRTRSLTPRVASPLNTSVRVAKIVEKHTRTDTPRPPSRRSVRKEDAFNPRLFNTPKSKNRTSQIESNFTPSLFNTPLSPDSSKRSTSVPQTTPSVPLLRRKRSASFPEERTPRKKHSAQPEDTFCPYMFRTPRIKPMHTPSGPEDIFMSDLFRSPPTRLLSQTRGASQLSSKKTPSKGRRPDTRVSPETSPLVLRETRVTRREPKVEKPREVKKRAVNINSPSSPAKVILVSPQKSPSASPFMIRTRITPMSPSPLPVRITRNRTSNKKNISSMAKKSVKSTFTSPNAKLVKFVKIWSPVGKAKPIVPVPIEIIEIDSSPSPPLVRVLRQRNASTKLVVLKTPPPSKFETRSSPSPINRRVLRSEKQTESKGILKTPSKRQVLQQARHKVTMNLSPMAPKLSNSKRAITLPGRTRAATVSFVLSPRNPVVRTPEDSAPNALLRKSTRETTTRMLRSNNVIITRSSRVK